MQTELVGGYATRENLAAPFLTTSVHLRVRKADSDSWPFGSNAGEVRTVLIRSKLSQNAMESQKVRPLSVFRLRSCPGKTSPSGEMHRYPR